MLEKTLKLIQEEIDEIKVNLESVANGEKKFHDLCAWTYHVLKSNEECFLSDILDSLNKEIEGVKNDEDKNRKIGAMFEKTLKLIAEEENELKREVEYAGEKMRGGWVYRDLYERSNHLRTVFCKNVLQTLKEEMEELKIKFNPLDPGSYEGSHKVDMMQLRKNDDTEHLIIINPLSFGYKSYSFQKMSTDGEVITVKIKWGELKNNEKEGVEK